MLERIKAIGAKLLPKLNRAQIVDVAERAASTAVQAFLAPVVIVAFDALVTQRIDLDAWQTAVAAGTSGAVAGALSVIKGVFATKRGDGSASLVDLEGSATVIEYPDGTVEIVEA